MRDGPDADGLREVLRADVADLAETIHIRRMMAHGDDYDDCSESHD